MVNYCFKLKCIFLWFDLNYFEFFISPQIYEEIQNVLEKHDDVINHETIGEMVLLEAALSENLRMYGPITENDRYGVCQQFISMQIDIQNVNIFLCNNLLFFMNVIQLWLSTEN